MRNNLIKFIEEAQNKNFDDALAKKEFREADFETIYFALNQIRKSIRIIKQTREVNGEMVEEYTYPDGEEKYYTMKFGIKTPEIPGIESELIKLWRFFVNKFQKMGGKFISDSELAWTQWEMISLLRKLVKLKPLTTPDRNRFVGRNLRKTSSDIPELLNLRTTAKERDKALKFLSEFIPKDLIPFDSEDLHDQEMAHEALKRLLSSSKSDSSES